MPFYSEMNGLGHSVAVFPFFYFFEVFFILIMGKKMYQKTDNNIYIFFFKWDKFFKNWATLCSGNVFAHDNAIYFIAVGCMKFLNLFLCIKAQLLEKCI